MSGGAMDYLYSRVEDAVGYMGDRELDAMMADLVKLLHDCEWWRSDDIGWDTYYKTICEFKTKWFGSGDKRIKRLGCIIDEEIEKFRNEMKEMIGSEVGNKEEKGND